MDVDTKYVHKSDILLNFLQDSSLMDVDDDDDEGGILSSQDGGRLKGNLKNHLIVSNLSLVMRKPVFGVSDQVRHKPGWAVT